MTLEAYATRSVERRSLVRVRDARTAAALPEAIDLANAENI